MKNPHTMKVDKEVSFIFTPFIDSATLCFSFLAQGKTALLRIEGSLSFYKCLPLVI